MTGFHRETLFLLVNVKVSYELCFRTVFGQTGSWGLSHGHIIQHRAHIHEKMVSKRVISVKNASNIIPYLWLPSRNLTWLRIIVHS